MQCAGVESSAVKPMHGSDPSAGMLTHPALSAVTVIHSVDGSSAKKPMYYFAPSVNGVNNPGGMPNPVSGPIPMIIPMQTLLALMW